MSSGAAPIKQAAKREVADLTEFLARVYERVGLNAASELSISEQLIFFSCKLQTLLFSSPLPWRSAPRPLGTSNLSSLLLPRPAPVGSFFGFRVLGSGAIFHPGQNLSSP